MKKTVLDTLLLGFALFAVFFGAGNLIFPPSIGISSGTNWVSSLVGFSITGVVLPLLAIIAILNAGGKFEDLTRPIAPWFYKVFNLLLMVGIGVFVTVPRMAATTHELGVQTLFPQVPSIVTIVIFFAITYFFAMDKSNVIDKIGKFLTPLLVVILLFIVGKGIINPIGTPIETELANPFSNAFISAYQTGDVITGIFLAPIFIAAILNHGYKGASMKKMAIAGTVVAGLGLLIIYGGLLFLGAGSSSSFAADIEGTALVSEIINMLLGNAGGVTLAIAIGLACLTSSIGVTAVISDFLSKLTNNRVGYKTFALIVSVGAAAMGSLGVEKIINYTMWIFTMLYPVAIVLVIIGVFIKFVPNAGAYRGAILFTFIVSSSETLLTLGVESAFLTNMVSSLPLSANGFSWLVPSIIGFIVGGIIDKIITKKEPKELIFNKLENDKLIEND